MCQDENKNEDEGFRSFWIKPVMNEPGPQYYDTLNDWFVRHAQVPEQSKASSSSWPVNRLLVRAFVTRIFALD